MNRSHIAMLVTVVSTAVMLSTTTRAQTRPETALRAAIELEEAKGDVRAAIEQYRKLAESRERGVAAQALLRLANAYQRLGDDQARTVYERLIREFADQSEATATARARLQVLAPSPGTREPSARRIWAGGPSGRISADGRFSTAGSNSGDLVLSDITARTTRRLTNTGGWVVSGDYADGSVISPDGRQVAYAWFLEKEDRYELRVVSTAASDARPRTVVRPAKGEWIGPGAWTPDGRRVVVAREPDRGVWQVGIVDVADGAYRSLKSLEWRNPGRIDVSPDGRYVAYEGQFPDVGSPRDILVLALDGSREITAVSGPADDFNPMWSPDGSHLLFMSNRTGATGLWATPIRDGRVTGSPTLLKADVGQISPLGITRSGTLYYMAPGNSRRDVYVTTLEGYRVTKAPTRVGDQFVNANIGPAWSPDGKTLAYYSMKGRPTLVLWSSDTGRERTVPLPPGVVNNPYQTGPRWFPDGRSLLVVARGPQSASQGFWRFSIDSGAAELLHQTQWTSSFAVAPDGSAIFWTASSPEETDTSKPAGRLMRFDISTRREVELKRGESFLTLALSPDGSQLAYLTSIRQNHDEAPSVVSVMPSAGGPARELLRDRIWLSGNRFNTLAWTPDQRNVIVMRDDGVLWRVPLDGTAPQHMNFLSDGGFWRPDGSVTPKVDISISGRFKSPAIHPDGKTLAFSLAQSDPGEIWALDNFLPSAAASK